MWAVITVVAGTRMYSRHHTADQADAIVRASQAAGCEAVSVPESYLDWDRITAR